MLTRFIVLLSVMFVACNNTTREQSIENNNVLLTNVLHNKLSIYIPKQLVKKGDEYLLEKFPLKDRPTEMFSTPDNKVNLTFNYGASPAKASDLPNIKSYLENLYRQANIIVENSVIKQINSKPYIYMVLHVYTKEGNQVYNYLFATDIEGKLLIGSFNFTQDMYNQWKNVPDSVITSIKLL